MLSLSDMQLAPRMLPVPELDAGESEVERQLVAPGPGVAQHKKKEGRREEARQGRPGQGDG